MNKQEELKKIQELLSSSKVCMMSTYHVEAGIHTRPMVYQQIEDDGTIWFFTNEYSPKVEEISVNNEISLSFINESKKNYVILTGKASLSKDEQKMKELFNPIVKAWFPKGLEDPKLALLKVELNSAEYWDNTSSTMVFLFNVAKALFSETVYKEGEHTKIDL